MLFYAQIEDGAVVPTNADAYKWHLMGLEGEKVEVRVQKPSAQRTKRQNRFYWGYLRMISQETGDDINSLHEFFKRKFLPPKNIEVSMYAEAIRIPGSTTDLKKQQEFSEYIARITALTGVLPPAPEQYGL